MKTIQNYINDLTTILVNSNTQLLDDLLPGLSEEDVKETFSKNSLSVLEGILALYTWRNGNLDNPSKTLGEKLLFPNGFFHPLENAEEIYQHFVVKNNYWSDEYFPIFSSGGGDFLLINLGKYSAEQGMIFLYSPPILLSNEIVSIYDSLELLFRSVVACFLEKAYTFKDNQLEIDFDLEQEISLRINPKAAYWQL